MHTPTAVDRLLRLTLPAAFALLALLAAPRAQAQTWNETGDAGPLLGTAQTTTGSGPLTAINGNLDSPFDVDLYCIRLTAVPPAGLPLVQLTCAGINGPNVYLLDATGKGVFTNQTCSLSSKTILAPNVSLAAGTYYLAVAYTGMDPQSPSGVIWLPGVLGQRAPDGPGGALALNSWSGTPNVQPINPYHVSLAFMSFCDGAVPTLRSTWGSVKAHYR